MKDILQEIIAQKQIEVQEQRQVVPILDLQKKVEQALDEGRKPLSMSSALAASPTGIIAEFKRKSPSKGWIFQDAEVDVVTKAYQENGAAALSILTDEQFFGGQMRFIPKVRSQICIPILRKDFIIDEYQLLQTRLMGADAVLLIAACLTKEKCYELARKAHELELETLLEIHTEAELDYLNEHTDMVGVNNRNLGTFHTDVQNSFDLAHSLLKMQQGRCRLMVSESGISDAATICKLRQQGFRGFLMGETFMRNSQPGEGLQQLIQEIERGK